jgi:actin related protein 2/3 complex subunit 4
MEDVDREISEMKLSLNARARTVAESYLTAVSLGRFSHGWGLALIYRC